LLGAIERRESRGAHIRSDHPDLDPDLKVNFMVAREDGRLAVKSEPVKSVPNHLQGWAKGDEDVEVARRLLE
jgi:succinate dehydrogenase / fumarate reductase, flavoprotein subunit